MIPNYDFDTLNEKWASSTLFKNLKNIKLKNGCDYYAEERMIPAKFNRAESKNDPASLSFALHELSHIIEDLHNRDRSKFDGLDLLFDESAFTELYGQICCEPSTAEGTERELRTIAHQKCLLLMLAEDFGLTEEQISIAMVKEVGKLEHLADMLNIPTLTGDQSTCSFERRNNWRLNYFNEYFNEGDIFTETKERLVKINKIMA